MKLFPMKPVNDWLLLLKQETTELNPSLGTLKAQAREPEFELLPDLSLIDRSTGQAIDYELLRPYLAYAGYNLATAAKLYLRDHDNAL